jgi:hypothetical protein
MAVPCSRMAARCQRYGHDRPAWKRLTEPPKTLSIERCSPDSEGGCRERPARDLAGSPLPGPEQVYEAPGLASRPGSAGGFDGGWLKVLRPVCDYIGVMRSQESGRGRPGGSHAARRRCRWVCRRGRIGAGRMPAEVPCGR